MNMSFFISIFRNSELSLIKKKLVLLYLLNVADIILTLFLIKTGMFMEANFIMALVINNNHFLSLIIKIGLPLILFIWVFHRMRKASDRQLFQSNSIINGCLVLYGFINISHITWFILLIRS